MFSDANNGNPEKSCYKEINNWDQNNLLNYGIILIVFGFYFV